MKLSAIISLTLALFALPSGPEDARLYGTSAICLKCILCLAKEHFGRLSNPFHRVVCVRVSDVCVCECMGVNSLTAGPSRRSEQQNKTVISESVTV